MLTTAIILNDSEPSVSATSYLRFRAALAGRLRFICEQTLAKLSIPPAKDCQY